MIAALLGKINQFDPELGEWTQYVENLDQYLRGERQSNQTVCCFSYSHWTRALQAAT